MKNSKPDKPLFELLPAEPATAFAKAHPPAEALILRQAQLDAMAVGLPSNGHGLPAHALAEMVRVKVALGDDTDVQMFSSCCRVSALEVVYMAEFGVLSIRCAKCLDPVMQVEVAAQ